MAEDRHIQFIFLSSEKGKIPFERVYHEDTPSFYTALLSLQQGDMPDSIKGQVHLWQSSSDFRRKHTKYSWLAQTVKSVFASEPAQQDLNTGERWEPLWLYWAVWQHYIRSILQDLLKMQCSPYSANFPACEGDVFSKAGFQVIQILPPSTPAASTAATHAVLFLE